MKLSEIQAVFWDFDGVIADSVNVKTQAFEEMFAPYGESICQQVVAHHKLHGGISRVEKIDYSFRHYVGQPLSREELDDKCEIYSTLVKQKVIESPLIKGAEAALEDLHTKVTMFVISGTPQDELLEIVDRRNLSRFFKRVLGSPMKKPIHVNNLLQEFQLDPGHCVFIGDALTDLNAALETGTRFIGIQGFNDFPDSITVLPDCSEMVAALQAI